MNGELESHINSVMEMLGPDEALKKEYDQFRNL